jgi:hypothetical protein
LIPVVYLGVRPALGTSMQQICDMVGLHPQAPLCSSSRSLDLALLRSLGRANTLRSWVNRRTLVPPSRRAGGVR